MDELQVIRLVTDLLFDTALFWCDLAESDLWALLSNPPCLSSSETGAAVLEDLALAYFRCDALSQKDFLFSSRCNLVELRINRFASSWCAQFFCWVKVALVSVLLPLAMSGVAVVNTTTLSAATCCETLRS